MHVLTTLAHDQHSVSTGIHVNETRSQQSARAACTQWLAWRCAPHAHSGPTEVEDCSLPPPNMAATKTGEQGKAWFSVL